MKQIVLVALFLIAVPVSAEEARPVFGNVLERAREAKASIEANHEARTDLRKEDRAERREFFASTTDAWKATVREDIKERVISRAERAGELVDAMIDRLYKLADRIDARITALEAEGKNMTDARASLTNARTLIKDAEAEIASVKAGIAAALETENPREALMEVKPLAESAKQAVRSAHQALVKTFALIPEQN